VKTLARVQRGLETLYRVDTGVTVDDFMIDEPTRAHLAPARRPREQLLVCEDAGEMALALFIDQAALDNLATNDPGRRLGDHNFGDFVLAVEGVSHFVYAIWCARAERPVTQLELELQAEVDKYTTALSLLLAQREGRFPADLFHRLFDGMQLLPHLSVPERERYAEAHRFAARFCQRLEEKFLRRRRARPAAMLAELRSFYRLGAHAKLRHAAQ
jgi:hypothetical protein